MKVEIEANELRNGKIEKLSLVDHGANQEPFRILKMRQISDSAKKTGGLKDTVSKFFGGDEAAGSKVVALYIRKSVARQWVPLAKKHGFTATKDSASLEGDVLVLKQEGYDPEVEGSIIALNEDVAIQLDHVSKFFDTFPMSDSFDENIKAAGFFPGLHSALDSLAETVWNVLNGSDSPEDAADDIAKQLKAFSLHVNNLVAELPQTVFKMEAESLTKEFGPSTVQDSSTKTIVEKDGETDMSTAGVLKEAKAGDLDGLLDDAPAADAALAKAAAETADTGDVQFFKGDVQLTKESFAALADDDEVIVKQKGEADKMMKKADIVKGGDEGAPKAGGSPGSPVVDSTSDTGVVSLDEGGVPEGFRKEERVMKTLDEKGNIVEKFAKFLINKESGEEIFAGFIEKLSAPVKTLAEATAAADGVVYTPAEVKLFEAMGVMAKSVTSLKELVEKQSAEIDAAKKIAGEAIVKADETVVMSAADDMDESLATLRGHESVSKAAPAATEVDIWKGALPQLEGNAA